MRIGTAARLAVLPASIPPPLQTTHQFTRARTLPSPLALVRVIKPIVPTPGLLLPPPNHPILPLPLYRLVVPIMQLLTLSSCGIPVAVLPRDTDFGLELIIPLPTWCPHCSLTIQVTVHQPIWIMGPTTFGEWCHLTILARPSIAPSGLSVPWTIPQLWISLICKVLKAVGCPADGINTPALSQTLSPLAIPAYGNKMTGRT